MIKSLIFACLFFSGATPSARAQPQVKPSVVVASGDGQIQAWKDGLGLNDQQVAKLQEISKARSESVRGPIGEMGPLRRKLADQVKNNASDADLRTTVDQLDRLQAAMRAAFEKSTADMQAVLTVNQRARLMLGQGNPRPAPAQATTSGANPGSVPAASASPNPSTPIPPATKSAGRRK